ncbi:Outer membrane porin protein [Paraburkholderia ultramafica]|uniref:Outer membrane porin protein n=1 Tax=Paraburkholderia ultramafica TaxID=1544867 RepID=A0A6S7B860_9BURK|nr:porin [Paraburkholderia ultramafica]CAB3790564.1 Outer membrane porin protein [Paraburkholderia ultramafica]
MKQKVIFAATLAALGATAAHAQSSVTLYGLLDAGISYTNNTRVGTTGHSNVALSNAMMQSNRWGLRGSEDLGGGLKALFVLENGFTLSNGKLGQGGREFGRAAYVGVSSNDLGTLTVGRQNEFMYDWVSRVSMENFNGAGGNTFAHVMDNDNMLGTFRVNNAVKYQSPNYYGLTVGGLFGFSNQAGGFGNNRAYSFGALYNNGPILATLGYTQLNNNINSLNSSGAVDNSANGSGTGDQNFTAGRQRTFGGGLNYTFGPAKVGFVITDTKLNNATAFPGGGTLTAANSAYVHFTNYEVNAHYSLTPALTLGAAYTFTDGKFDNPQNSASPKWSQVSLLSDYTVSKRTDLYAVANWSHLNGGLNLAAPGNSSLTAFAGASSYIGGIAATKNQVVVGAGIRTRF